MIQWLASLEPHCAQQLAMIADDPSWNEGTLLQSVQSEHVNIAVWQPSAAEGAAGFCAVSIGPFDMEIEMIAVARQWRRCGIAKKLVAALQARLRGGEGERLLLEVRASNAPALALYRQCGFVLDGRRRDYYPLVDGGREDALLMSWSAESDEDKP
ncbi:GNAT family N-acetyltransferase [Carnimonas nigrificans]|uniref:GNAT family N-acetyltransferase n=1 Tax=Carnimonas nigrificans TaxID=64323 RepID=UPI0004728326|nr:GNAT family N-acetyltransferase [Carnimonas nigrificans]